MARQLRVTLPGVAQHVIQRGNNRQAIFHDNEDRGLFSAWLSQCARRHEVEIHAWVYMTNHIHLLVTPQNDTGLPRMMQALGRNYVRYFNKRHKRTGTLYEGRYKSCVVGCDQYLLACYRYIELNPVRAGMASAPEEYLWSSYGCNACGSSSGFVVPHATYLGLGSTPSARQVAYRGLFADVLCSAMVDEIRSATQRGHALGSAEFKSEVESMTGRRVTPGQPGRPRGSTA